ncbi:MAG: hypothetical protein C0503_04790 [Gemmatimonas sp.]|nr:hypothetical protein [Gemmatimonas sp.]
MPTHIALLRAINVGGTGKLPMTELRALCEGLGFANVRTYIQSGNVVFESRLSAKRAQQALEDALEARLGKRHAVLLRSVEELASIETRNPFPDADPKQLLIVLLDAPPPRDALAAVKIPGRERLHLDGRELFIHFPDGMGRSKLKIPLAGEGTGRNLNTIRALLRLAAP